MLGLAMRLDATLTSTNPRYVIVHYHIFKNGGTTIEAILEREFGHRFATLHDTKVSATLSARHVASFLRRHPQVSAISSHHLRYPKPDIRHTIVFDCCFLRHPLERLDSVYHYLRTIAPLDTTSCRARQMSAREFLRHLADESPHMVSDVQVTQLACAGAFTRPAHAEDLERASAVLSDMAIPGLVEMFDESLVAAEYFLRPAFPGVRLECVAKNVSRPGGTAVSSNARARQERLVDAWGGDLYEDLLRLNQLDLELFRRAQKEIGRRIALVPESERRLAEFRERCSRLQAGASRDGETSLRAVQGTRA
jgi:hypothetical protein